MEGKVKILETYPKSEEIKSFDPTFSHICRLLLCSDYIEQNCHVLVATLCNLNFACQHISLRENLIIWSICLGCTKM